MRIVNYAGQGREEWRSGVLTRMRVSALNGSVQLCIFEQWYDPGCGTPTYLHVVEEVLTVLDGRAEIWVGEERATLTAGQSVIAPAGLRHGFRNVGESPLHMEAVLAASIFEAASEDLRETRRCWLHDALPTPPRSSTT
jgi:mannose-6-phosphate isomerase-like protein (cupin superfamily)